MSQPHYVDQAPRAPLAALMLALRHGNGGGGQGILVLRWCTSTRRPEGAACRHWATPPPLQHLHHHGHQDLQHFQLGAQPHGWPPVNHCRQPAGRGGPGGAACEAGKGRVGPALRSCMLTSGSQAEGLQLLLCTTEQPSHRLRTAARPRWETWSSRRGSAGGAGQGSALRQCWPRPARRHPAAQRRLFAAPPACGPGTPGEGQWGTAKCRAPGERRSHALRRHRRAAASRRWSRGPPRRCQRPRAGTSQPLTCMTSQRRSVSSSEGERLLQTCWAACRAWACVRSAAWPAGPLGGPPHRRCWNSWRAASILLLLYASRDTVLLWRRGLGGLECTGESCRGSGGGGTAWWWQHGGAPHVVAASAARLMCIHHSPWNCLLVAPSHRSSHGLHAVAGRPASSQPVWT